MFAGLRRERRARRRRAEALGELRGHRRLLVQQEPRRLLRADQLPHGVAQGQLPGRVHGGADLERHEHQGQGARSSSTSATSMGIEVLPPDVNESDSDFIVVEGNDPLRPQRREGRRRAARSRRSSPRARTAGRSRRSTTSARASTRTLVNKRTLEALIKSGAFDSTGDTRRGMLEALPAAMADGERRRKDRAAVRAASSTYGRRRATRAAPPAVSDEEWEPRRRVCASRRRRSASTSRRTRSRACATSCATEVDVTVGALDETRRRGHPLDRRHRRRRAAQGEQAAAACGSSSASRTSTAAASAVAWASTYEQYRELLVEDSIVNVKGRLDRKSRGRGQARRPRGRAVRRGQRVPAADARPSTPARCRRRYSTTSSGVLARLPRQGAGRAPHGRRRPAHPPARRRRVARRPGGRPLRGAQGAARREQRPGGRLRTPASHSIREGR